MQAKELVGLFFKARNESWRDVPRQMRYAKTLCSKYTTEQLEKAIEVYGNQMYSLAFLNDRNMGHVMQKVGNSVNITYDDGGEDIATRNKRRIERIANESRERESHYLDLLNK